MTREFESSLTSFILYFCTQVLVPALRHEYKSPFSRAWVLNKHLPYPPLLFGCCRHVEFALPCHQQFLTLTMSSTRTPLPATPWATSLLAAWWQPKELTVDSSPFESEISPSLAPSDSALQAPHHRQKPHQTQKFDVNDLTNLLLSDEENILCMFTFWLCCPNFIFFYLLSRLHASSMDCPMLPIFWEGETAAGPRW